MMDRDDGERHRNRDALGRCRPMREDGDVSVLSNGGFRLLAKLVKPQLETDRTLIARLCIIQNNG